MHMLRACGATIVNRTDELQESDVGTGAGLFEIKKIGDEYVFAKFLRMENYVSHFHVFDVVFQIRIWWILTKTHGQPTV